MKVKCERSKMETSSAQGRGAACVKDEVCVFEEDGRKNNLYGRKFCSFPYEMTTSHHVELDAAKLLQKLIQDSKDEPAKLATKLFVICQHMKLSGKEHSLPYQVISSYLCAWSITGSTNYQHAHWG
ncbi:hypothetical protein IEQ34_003847 [Dendrobium chrysotoxum]|uniref:Uncharacterized protein n=1 Tax=Dendrobium chrysotoxum TaxID=161865 RepID=A0AAV7HFL7_DENCH|nr:hypothetical protein IEQ34_003847 [Dendrobium chrysotoxum]